MRFLILSDIHANWEALHAVVDDAAGEHDQIAVCGDLVGYGADPDRCVEWTRLSAGIVIRGNHDKAAVGLTDLEWFNPAAQVSALWTRSNLTPENLDYVRTLPSGPVTAEHFLVVHGSPRDEDEYLVTRSDVAGVSPFLDGPLTFFGHTHLQGAFLCHRNGVKEVAKARRGDRLRSVELEPDSFYMINPGSVGQPRDGDPRAAYALYDTETRCVTLRRTAYSISRAQEKIRNAGLPDVLAARLAIGR